MGIGNKDTVLIIVDLMKSTKVLDGPDGKEQAAPSLGARASSTDGDKVTGLDFTGTPKPDGKLQLRRPHRGHRRRGQEGPDDHGQLPRPGLQGQEAVRRELQQARRRRSPSAWARSSPAGTRRLVGAKVGSRMILAIPPADGYGKQGNPQAGIKGTDTLYFVVDILAAS